MNYGSGQGDGGFELDNENAHPLPIKGGETCEWGCEAGSTSAGSSPFSHLSPNGKSKR
jgi:hypothetical protein